MSIPEAGFPQSRRAWWLVAVAVTAFLFWDDRSADGQAAKLDVLRIGTSGTLSSANANRDDKSSLETLRGFIKDETGLNSEIERQKDCPDLLDKMSKGQLQVGVLQGFEYARMQAHHPELKPLAVAVNIYVYPIINVVTGPNGRATDFAGLKGQSLIMLGNSPGHFRLYVERQCHAAGAKPETFFSKISSRDNFEDALDDVVDGTVDATVVDQAALDAFKQKKPGRFNRLKTVARSQPFPPAVVAYYGTFLDEATRKQFSEGLLNASNKEKGQTMLTIFRLTGFQVPPADFEKVLAATREAYPPLDAAKQK
jgi:ABC-type phosphate/phosphonate transport system substrate-binding protein